MSYSLRNQASGVERLTVNTAIAIANAKGLDIVSPILYTSFSSTVRLAAGTFSTIQKFDRLANFVGVSDTYSASFGPLGGSATHSTSDEPKYIGYGGQAGIGPFKAGVSGSTTNTDLSMCWVLQ